MSYESFLADPVAVRDYGDWLVVLHPVDPDDITHTLYFSRRGTATVTAVTVGSYTIPAHTPFRRRLVAAPTITHSLWSRGGGDTPHIGGESQPAYGGIQLVNQDGGLDQYRATPDGWRWKNTPAQIFQCDSRPHNIATTIGCVFDGLVGEAKIDLRGAEIALTGLESYYGEMTSDRVFRGTGYQLEIAGDKTVDFGNAGKVDLQDGMSLEAWLWMDVGPTSSTPIWGWTDGSEYPWRVIIRSNRALRLAATVGGVVEQVTTSYVLVVGRPYHISINIDGENVTFRIWDDDAQTMEVETFIAAFSSTTRDPDNGGKLKFKTSPDATLTLWGDEMRVWDVVRTEAEHDAYRFGEIADGEVPASLVHYARFNEGTGSTIVDSAAGANDGTITGPGFATWLWAMEGGPDLANTPKPEVWGFKYYVAPVLVDPVRNAYLVSPADTQNALDGILATQEGGNPHIVDAEAVSLRAFITTTPVAGHMLPYSARGLFMLGSTPTLPVSADVNGFGGSGGTAFLPDIIEQLVTTRLPVTPTLDAASFTALASAVAMPGASFGVFLPRPEPIRQVIDFLMAGAMAWWGHFRGEQALHVEQFVGPGVAADYAWDERHIVNIEPLDAETVIYGVEVKFNQNHTVLSKDQVAGVIKGTADWLRWTQEWQYARRTGARIRAQFPGDASIIYTLETGRRGRTNAELFADYVLALIKGAKEAWRVTLKPVGRVVKVGQTCTLSVTLQRGRQRLNLDGTTRYVILDVTDTQQRGEVMVSVWGGDM